MSLKTQAVSGIFWTSMQTFGGQIINFGVSVILARLLLPAEFGLIGMIGIFLGIGGALISGGLASSLIRTTDPDHADYSTVFVFNMVGSILIYSVLFFAAPFIAAFFEQPQLILITRIYSLSFIVGAFGSVQGTRFKKQLNFKAGTTASLTATLIAAAVGVTLAFTGFGVMSLVWMAVVSAAIKSLMLWIQSSWKPSLLFDNNKFKTHFAFGSRITLSGILSVGFENIYTILIGKFFSATQLGFYTRANSLKQLPVSTLSSILNQVTYPLLAEIKDDDRRLRSVYSQILKMVIFIVAPVLVLMGVLAEPLFRFLFTDKWLPAVPYFQILCINGVLYPLHNYNLNILLVKGRSNLFLRLEIVQRSMMMAVILSVFQFGIYGLLWGQVLISILACFINTYYSGKFISYGIWQQFKDILPTLILSATMGGVVFVIDYLINNQHDLVRLLVSSLTGIAFFGIFARVFKFHSGKMAYEIIKKKFKFTTSV